MSLTAPNTTGTWSAFWNMANDGAAGNYPYQNAPTPMQDGVSRLTSRFALRDVRAALYALMGAAVGGAASDSYGRVVAPTLDASNQTTIMGGVRAIETKTVISRVTTAADLTYMQTMLNRYFNMLTSSFFVADKAGISGARTAAPLYFA
jgi:hypothetical protein